MQNTGKALFLPIHERILNRESGYVTLEETFPEITDADVYKTVEQEKLFQKEGWTLKTFWFFYFLLLSPALMVFTLTGFEKGKRKIYEIYDFFRRRIFRLELEIVTQHTEKYQHLLKEDIGGLLEDCRNLGIKVFIYTWAGELSQEQETKIADLKDKGLIHEVIFLTRITQLIDILRKNNFSSVNSRIVVANAEQIEELRGTGFIGGINIWTVFDKGIGCLSPNIDTLGRIKRELEPFYLSSKKKSYDKRDVLFFPNPLNGKATAFIRANYKAIQQKLSAKGMTLIYIPEWIKCQGDINESQIRFIRSFLPVYHNLNNEGIREVFRVVLENFDEARFYKAFFDVLDLPHFWQSCFLTRVETGVFTLYDKFWAYPLSEESVETDVDAFLDLVKITEWGTPSYSLDPDLLYPDLDPEKDSETQFHRSRMEEFLEIRDKIELAKQNGNFLLLAETVLYLMDIIRQNRPALAEKLLPYLEETGNRQIQITLSPLYIDKHHRIFLPHYGNVEILLRPLTKAVYLLFLRHPEGIRFKELFEYKDELRSIYNTLTNKGSLRDIESTLDELLDVRKPNISIHCSRIRAAFRKHLSDSIAEKYFIDGQKGEAKKISLSPDLIVME